MLCPVTNALLSPEVAAVLEKHGVAAEPTLLVLHADDLVEVLRSVVGPDRIEVAPDPKSIVRTIRARRVAVVVVGDWAAEDLLDHLAKEHQTVGVVIYQREVNESAAAAMRSRGAIEIVSAAEAVSWPSLLRRAMDYRALLVLELLHRCESKRLVERELELLGLPPESMSDDLTGFQPPPLPVGPMSVYNLEEASESFEAAYIDRVQQLCGSAREAAEYLGVSSATLSRRLRKEVVHGS